MYCCNAAAITPISRLPVTPSSVEKISSEHEKAMSGKEYTVFPPVLFFLHRLGLLVLVHIEQRLYLLPQCLYASEIDVFLCLSFAHHFGMDIPQGEQKREDNHRNSIEKQEKSEPHICSQEDYINSPCI